LLDAADLNRHVRDGAFQGHRINPAPTR